MKPTERAAYHDRLAEDAHELLHELVDWFDARTVSPAYALQIASHAIAMFAVAALEQFESNDVTASAEQVSPESALTLRRTLCRDLPDRVSERFRAETERMTRDAKGAWNQ